MSRYLSLSALGVLLLGLLLFANCSSPLENYPNPGPPGPLLDVETVLVTDTLILGDTVISIDTVLTPDTVIVVDTIPGADTVIVTDTVITVDTMLVVDTVVQYDTVVQVDTLVRTDTLIQTDTLVQADTVLIIDTVVQIDTVIVNLPDTSSTRTLCTRMGSQQKEIVWLLHVVEGSYRLEFSAYVERGQPPQRVTVVIDGTTYEWLPRDLPDLVIDTDLGPSPTIMILPDNPGAFGHSIDFCLTLTRL
jgi:hypothetical protein